MDTCKWGSNCANDMLQLCCRWCCCCFCCKRKTMKKSRVHTVWLVFKWMNFTALPQMRFRDKGTDTGTQVHTIQPNTGVGQYYIGRGKSFISILCSRFVECPTNDYKNFNRTRLCRTLTPSYPWLKAWHLQIFFDHFNGWTMSVHAIFFILPRCPPFAVPSLDDEREPSMATHCFWFLHKNRSKLKFSIRLILYSTHLATLLPISDVTYIIYIHFHHFSVWNIKCAARFENSYLWLTFCSIDFTFKSINMSQNVKCF